MEKEMTNKTTAGKATTTNAATNKPASDKPVTDKAATENAATVKTTRFAERKRWLFLGLPFTFTKYTINDERLIIKRGFLNTTEDTCYLYKIIDTRINRSLFERMVGLGTVVCYTGDTTDKKIELKHIKHSKEVSDYLIGQTEEMRRKRRTLNTLSLTQGMTDIDDAYLDE